MNERRRNRPDLPKGMAPSDNAGRDFSVSRDPRARVEERPAKSGAVVKPSAVKPSAAKPRQSKLDYDKPRHFRGDAAKSDAAKGGAAKSDFGRNNLNKAHPDKARSASSGYDKPRFAGDKPRQAGFDPARFDAAKPRQPRFDADAPRDNVYGEASAPRGNRPPKQRHVEIDYETEIETRDTLHGAPRVPHNKADEKLIYGFHAVLARLRHDPAGVLDIYVDVNRRDARSRDLIHHARDAGVNLSQVEIDRIERLVGKGATHQGVVARVRPVALAQSLDDILDAVVGPPLLLLLDGVTDPHNLGAILRSASAFGVHAVVAPKDNAVGINATVEKVASGAADSVPYLMVTNLARTIDELKERNVWVIAADMDGESDIGGIDCKTGIAWVLGAEGGGIRRLVKQGCDQVARIPIGGVVESLNVSVSAALCLYETARQRGAKRA
jgi:23S rRNA (guanosine2251-2'-O)-methyltransferase